MQIRFTRLTATDTFSYRELDFKFDSGIHSIIGANGASKTSIFMTLCQGLFNRNPKGTKVDDVSNEITNKPYEIEVCFTKGTSEWKVINSKKTGTIRIIETTAEGKEHDRHLKRIPDNLKLIEDILGVNYATFVDLTYQSKTSSLNLLESTSDGDRKQFVGRMCHLDEVDADYSRIKELEKSYSDKKTGKLVTLGSQISNLNQCLQSIQEELAQVDTTELSERIASATSRMAEHTAESHNLSRAVKELTDREQAARESATAQTKLDELTRQLSLLPEIGLTMAELYARKQDWTSELSSRMQEVSRYNKLIKAAAEHQLEQDEIERCLEEINGMRLPDRDRQFCEKNLGALKDLKSSSGANSASIKVRIKELERSLGDGTCPTCKQSLPDKEALSESIKALTAELAEVSSKYDKATAAIPIWEGHVLTWAQYGQKQERVARLNAQLTPLSMSAEEATTERDKALSGQEEAQLKIAALNEDISATISRERMEVLIEAAARSRTESEPLDTLLEHKALVVSQHRTNEELRVKLASELRSAEAELERARDHNSLSRARKTLNEQVRESNFTLQAKIDHLQDELRTAEETAELLKTWLGILGPKGYRVRKINKFLGVFNTSVNKYALMITGGRIKIRFFMNEDGEIDFEVVDANKSIKWANWSDGEKARVRMSCLFAVLDILESSGASSFNTLALDEVFGALDAEGREGLFRVLAYLQGRGKSIYTIAHSDLALPMAYDTVIHAEKKQDGTTTITQ